MQINIDAPVIVRSDFKQKIEYLGRYKVEKMIGQGSFGTVYRCCTYKGYEYAIKQINNVKMKKMMSNELDALKSVTSKYVVRYYEVFYDKQDHACIVLELCEGGTLYDLMRRYDNNVIPEKSALEIFVQILVGFKEIHSAHLIHRDIKLQNILIKNNSPKIADFGLVAQTDDKINGFAGTPAYMAPEILNGQSYDQQVDIWSLGILLYAMLFNDFPLFESTTYLQYQRIRQFCLPTFNFNKLQRSRYQNVKQETKDFLAKMLVVDPSKRATLNELLEQQIMKDHDINGDLVIKEEANSVVDYRQVLNKQKQQLKTLNSLQVDTSPILQKLHLFDFSSSVLSTISQTTREDEISSSHKLSPDQTTQTAEIYPNLNNRNDSNQNNQNEYNQNNQNEYNLNRNNDVTNKNGKTNNKTCAILKKGEGSSPYEIHLVPYNQMLNRITQLVDTYELFANGDPIISAEFNQNEINLILYFLSRIILFYFQGLNKILDERENVYQVSNWSKFVFSKSYLNILSQVQIDLQIWMEKSNIIYNHLQLLDLISFDQLDQINLNNQTQKSPESESETNMKENTKDSNDSNDQKEEKEKQEESKLKSLQAQNNNNNQSNDKNIQRQQIKLMPEIVENIISPLETQVGQDFSFMQSKLPESIKIAFRAVMITAYTRLYNSYQDEEYQEISQNTSSLSHITMSQIASQTNLTTSKSYNLLNSPQIKKAPNTPSLILQSPIPNQIKSNTQSSTNLAQVKKSSLTSSTSTKKISLTNINTPSNTYLQTLKNHSLLTLNSTKNSPLPQQSQQLSQQNNNNNNNIQKQTQNNSKSTQLKSNLQQSSTSSSSTSKRNLTSNNLVQFQQQQQQQSTSSITSNNSLNKIVFHNIKDKQVVQQKVEVAKANNLTLKVPSSSIMKPSSFHKSSQFIENLDETKKQNNLLQLRYSFRILLCCTLHHYMILNDQTIKLIGFQQYLLKKCETKEFNNEELLKQFICWQRDIDQDTIESEKEFIFKNYLPFVEKQLDLSFF